jgi:prolipoprotein diacylglyceryltransferase
VWWLYLAVWSLVRFASETLRGDEAAWLGLTPMQWFSSGLFLAAVVGAATTRAGRTGVSRADP